jgi:hypothetical protein
MTAIVGTNARVSVQQTLGVAKAVTAVVPDSNGTATVTASGHGYSNGDIVVFTVDGGMVQLNGQAVRVSGVAGDDFDLEGLDTTDYDTWTEGTVQKVTAFQTLSSAQNITMPNPAPLKLDATTLIDKQKQYVYGLPDAPDGTVTGLFNPTGTAEGLIRAATKGNDFMVWKVVFASGLTAVFNANVSGGQGFDLQTNAVATATTSFTPKADVMYYAS